MPLRLPTKISFVSVALGLALTACGDSGGGGDAGAPPPEPSALEAGSLGTGVGGLTLRAPKTRTVVEGEVLEFRLEFAPALPDRPYFDCVATKDHVCPANLRVDRRTGVVRWRPDYGTAGTYPLTFGLTSGGRVAVADVAVTVTAKAPAALRFAVATREVVDVVKGPLDLDLRASDDPRARVTYTLAAADGKGLGGAAFDAARARLLWTPKAGEVGQRTFVVTAKRGSETATQDVVVDVLAEGRNDEWYLTDEQKSATVALSALPATLTVGSTVTIRSACVVGGRVEPTLEAHLKVSDGEFGDDRASALGVEVKGSAAGGVGRWTLRRTADASATSAVVTWTCVRPKSPKVYGDGEMARRKETLSLREDQTMLALRGLDERITPRVGIPITRELVLDHASDATNTKLACDGAPCPKALASLDIRDARLDETRGATLRIVRTFADGEKAIVLTLTSTLAPRGTYVRKIDLDPPTGLVAPAPALALRAGVPFEASLTVAPARTLAFSKTRFCPEWLRVDPVTGELSGTPAATDVGGFGCGVDVRSGDDSDSVFVTGTVVAAVDPATTIEGPVPETIAAGTTGSALLGLSPWTADYSLTCDAGCDEASGFSLVGKSLVWKAPATPRSLALKITARVQDQTFTKTFAITIAPAH